MLFSIDVPLIPIELLCPEELGLLKSVQRGVFQGFLQ